MPDVESVMQAWSTSLATKELAELFRSTAEAAGPSSVLARIAANRNARSRQGGLLRHSPSYSDQRNELAFFTPVSDSPFAQFEARPDYAVGASIADKSGRPHVVHMYVTETEARRDVEFRSLYIRKFGETAGNQRRAAKVLSQFVAALRLADPAASEA